MGGSYRDLLVWQKAIDLSVLVYQLTDGFPSSELYGLVSQMRRAAVAVASNVAEGQGRGSKKEFRQFLRIAFGSTSELETQIIISEKVGFSTPDSTEKLLTKCNEIKKMIVSLEKSLFKV